MRRNNMTPTAIAILGLLCGLLYCLWANYRLGKAVLAVMELTEYQEQRIIELERNSK